MPSFEVLLPLGALAFYLYDSASMLYGNELVLERGTAWRCSLGLPLQAGGRRLHLPNPFTPHRLLFRVRWDQLEAGGPNPLDATALQRAAAPLGALVRVQAILLLVVLPPVSLLFGAGNLLLVLFVVFYALSLCALVLLWYRRAGFGVSRRQAWLMTAESLLCAPFAVNLVRKVGLAQSDRLRWLAEAEQTFDPGQRVELMARVGARIDELLIIEAPESATAVRLESLRTQLKARLDGALVA